MVELSEREKSVLRYVIHQFILTANPVGSRNITKKYDLGYSPATVRNVMSDLEEFGLLNHPHTSAGRIPTDKGYRVYVDMLMDPPMINKEIKNRVEEEYSRISSETDDLLKITATLLSEITNQLACVTFPKFENAVLEKIQLVSLTSRRVMVVVTVKSGLVKTITLEIESEMDRKALENSERILNERLSGLKFSEIRDTFKDRLKDYFNSNYKPIIRLFFDSIDKIFKDIKISDKSIITGTKNVINQPEFDDPQNFRGIIELVEDKDVIIHIMEEESGKLKESVEVIIGSESKDIKLNNYSLLKREYNIDESTGVVGLIGPKRMEYSKALAAVIYMAEFLSKELKRSLHK